MANNKLPRVPVREQDPVRRASNFEEVCYGYDAEEALTEASRCLHCKNPRCVAACPVNIRIPDFIAALAAGDTAQAAAIIGEDSSLPSVCGRVCPQETQCEGSCVLGIKGEPVAIGKLERYVGDWQLEHGTAEPVRTVPRNGHRVAVVGSGPAGLACASDLAKMGYEVKVFEALHKVGGVLVYGIPEFRLPKERIVAREIEAVRALGVEFETDVIVGRTVTVDSLLDDEGFDAVFIGSGAGLPRFMGIPGENLNGVVSANEFLTRTNLMHAYDPAYDTPIQVGRHVVVVGGGNVAMESEAARKIVLEGAIFGPGVESIKNDVFLTSFNQVFGFSDSLASDPIFALGFADHLAKGLFAFTVNGAFNAAFSHLLVNHVTEVNLRITEFSKIFDGYGFATAAHANNGENFNVLCFHIR